MTKFRPIENPSVDSKIIVFSGEPLNEPIVAGGHL